MPKVSKKIVSQEETDNVFGPNDKDPKVKKWKDWKIKNFTGEHLDIEHFEKYSKVQ